MNKIVAKQELATKIKLVEIYAPESVEEAKPGQFVILHIDEKGERFPLTIVDANISKGTISLVFNEVGKSTKQLGILEEGDDILNLAGPLGNPSEIENFGRVLCIGGGVMIAPLWFVASALRKAGNEIIGVIGARNKDLLIFEDEMKAISDEFYITTDDGSKGYTGLDFLNKILSQKNINRVVTMGSVVTMKAVSEMTKSYGIKTMVTLTPIMVDGTGMCGCCRVSVGGEIKYACIDGPEFDGHAVDWNLLVSRKRIYLPEERISSLLNERLGGINP
ncbi:MAG: sulfide/dihydroorotate dehydrogenase-like FAD/NAD-binding protein [Candidatus Cloacimonetes bacterium]|nr:sulfide/dihydroorotate dehydrogenase-like FAD/NAD-binding protein [Candidatus Cloacimonadota bacterium]MBL7086915.1 sulfide/dihydroorotate dehydrogenase-like FAD/NAD-binding protein [Candidatus Cloacimonadota bacterium]